MRLLDDQGRVGGYVNVIDVLAGLLLVAVLVSGAAIVVSAPAEGADTEPMAVTVTMDVHPAEAEHWKQVAEDSTTVRDVTEVREVWDESSDRVLVRLDVTVVWDVTERTDGSLWHDDERLSVGEPATIDAGMVVERGTVVDIRRL